MLRLFLENKKDPYFTALYLNWIFTLLPALAPPHQVLLCQEVKSELSKERAQWCLLEDRAGTNMIKRCSAGLSDGNKMYISELKRIFRFIIDCYILVLFNTNSINWVLAVKCSNCVSALYYRLLCQRWWRTEMLEMLCIDLVFKLILRAESIRLFLSKNAKQSLLLASQIHACFLSFFRSSKLNSVKF